MFLKSLTLRGFKSFADKTQLVFEPGITVIVGPNGSGKSNVVDALSWVLGTHSAKSLRGGSMADVIFAGAPGKPALGRASAEITIDNSDGALPIEFSEVTVSRSMFASGETDYAINKVDCRLLDVQELLSDTGLGRENHTIVGQGQIDAVLNAKPEERRAFIEEAAGILKHRKRKERALRKLAQTDVHVERLQDVLRELRRNLRPLERQAEAAAKHAELAERLRQVRIALALREMAGLASRWEAESSHDRDSQRRLTEREAALESLRAEESAIERELAELAPVAELAVQTHFRLAGLVERYRGLSGRIEERRRGLLDAVEEPIAGRDPAQLRDRAAEERRGLQALEAEASGAFAALHDAEEHRGQAEQARRAHEQAAAAEARRRTEARERVLRWEGEMSALRSALAQAAGEEGRLASQVSGLASRIAELESDIAAAQAEIQRLDGQEGVLSEQLAAAEAAMDRRQRIADAAAARERELERQRASLEARADALRAASQEATEGIAALLAAAEAGEIHGVVGPLADQVSVVDGAAKAAAAALGPVGDALVVWGRGAAESAVRFVTSRRSGRVLLLAAEEEAEGRQDPDDPPGLIEQGARPLITFLRAETAVLAALRRAVAGVYVVDDYQTACQLAARHHRLVFVSRDGHVAGARGYAGGSAGSASAVLSRAAAEQAEAQLEVVSDELLRAHRQLADADRDLAAARHELDAATAAMQESDGLITFAAERMNRLRKERANCDREAEALHAQQEDLGREIAERRSELASLEVRGQTPTEASEEPDGTAPDLEAERLEDLLAQAREQEVQARLAASAVSQRSEEQARRAEALETEADDVERRLAERERRRVARLAAIERCGELERVTATALSTAEESLMLASAERDQVEERRSQLQRRLGVARASVREREDELAALRDERHREDLARQELRHALDAVRARLADELGLDPDEALAEARAQGDQGPLGGGEETDQTLGDEETGLIRKVALLGTVNPLALEEFHALEERHAFLTGQLEDLRGSRRDLENVIQAVDERIRAVFEQAFADVAVEFERIFPRLFPGGEGRLVLTDPDDLLDTGVEVEARPAGKRVKRLSLLSGGERSLTALAVLFAIFAARPSPFYVLDEVEAALDDVNLQRFLHVLRDFRSSSQLLVITHQKRTMEVADSLYGITMRGDGVSKVVSQRLTEVAAAS
ncbi:MAG TPA: chromosome segregation protein SMC [Egibacteraceae bacterium]|nr:chromosome segregation protein SMC [Egibacteraceae bacterium]